MTLREYNPQNELEFIQRCEAFVKSLGDCDAIISTDKKKFQLVNPKHSREGDSSNSINIKKIRGRYYVCSDLEHNTLFVKSRVIYRLKIQNFTATFDVSKPRKFFARRIVKINSLTRSQNSLLSIRYQERCSSTYNTRAAIDFICTVQDWAKSVKGSFIRLDLNQTKIRRGESGLPFSILRLGEGESKRYVAISNMQVGDAGGFGRVKVVYPLKVSQDQITVFLDKPEALKILVVAETFLDDEELVRPTRVAIKQLKDIHSPFGQQQRLSTSTKHRTHTLDNIREIAEDQSITENKKYYTMPLYPGVDIWKMSAGYRNIKKYNWGENGQQADYCLITLFLKMAKGLKFFHDQKLVHTDVKEGNILIHWPPHAAVDDAEVYLVDLDGLAQEGEFYQRVYNKTYQPESIRAIGRHKIFCHQDIYSLGVIMKNMLIRLYLTEKFAGNYSKELWSLLEKMTLLSSEHRPTIDAVIDGFKGIQTSLEMYKVSERWPQPSQMPLPASACFQYLSPASKSPD